jgi:phage recombination protein Bet
MVVKYKSEGLDLTLTESMVKQFLVRGNNQAVSRQEIVFFLGLCQARKLNPLAGDCYLVKYGNDPAAIITSIDYFRARARKNPDCRGWQKGIVVQKEDGTLRYSSGLILAGEKLVGGWFETTPDNWNVPFKLEVNLNGYIKKTREGSTTKFWSEDNQPTMIAKIAESQGLRAVWPRDFGKLYTAEEVGSDPDQAPPTIDMDVTTGEIKGSVQMFNDLAREKTAGDAKKQATLFRYVVACADHYRATEDQVKIDASLQFERFFATFEQWAAKQAAPASRKGQDKAPEIETVKDTPREDRPSQGQPGGQEEEKRIPCPKENGEERRTLKWCQTSCNQKEECQPYLEALWK